MIRIDMLEKGGRRDLNHKFIVLVLNRDGKSADDDTNESRELRALMKKTSICKT